MINRPPRSRPTPKLSENDVGVSCLPRDTSNDPNDLGFRCGGHLTPKQTERTSGKRKSWKVGLEDRVVNHCCESLWITMMQAKRHEIMIAERTWAIERERESVSFSDPYTPNSQFFSKGRRLSSGEGFVRIFCIIITLKFETLNPVTVLVNFFEITVGNYFL